MPADFKAGRIAIRFDTDGYPYQIEIHAKHANGTNDQEPLRLTHNDLLDLNYCLQRTISALIKG